MLGVDRGYFPRALSKRTMSIMKGIGEQIVDDSLPEILEESVKVVRLVPQERVQRRITEQIVDLLVSGVMKDGVEVARVLPQDGQVGEVPVPQVADQFVARSVTVPVLLILKETAKVLSLVPHVQISDRICEQIGEVAVPQVAEQFVTRCAEHIVSVQCF